jgi:hypothetical protein
MDIKDLFLNHIDMINSTYKSCSNAQRDCILSGLLNSGEILSIFNAINELDLHQSIALLDEISSEPVENEEQNYLTDNNLVNHFGRNFIAGLLWRYSNKKIYNWFCMTEPAVLSVLPNDDFNQNLSFQKCPTIVKDIEDLTNDIYKNSEQYSLKFLLLRGLKNAINKTDSFITIDNYMMEESCDLEKLEDKTDPFIVTFQNRIENSFKKAIESLELNSTFLLNNLDIFMYYRDSKNPTSGQKNNKNIEEKKTRSACLKGYFSSSKRSVVKEYEDSDSSFAYNSVKSMIKILNAHKPPYKLIYSDKGDYFPQISLVIEYILATKIIKSVFNQIRSNGNSIFRGLSPQFEKDLHGFKMLSKYFFHVSDDEIDQKINEAKNKFDFYQKLEDFNLYSDWTVFNSMVKEYPEIQKKGQTSFKIVEDE